MDKLFVMKKENISEKAFVQGLVVSVVSILLCIAALCSMTYAWFSGGTSSDANRLVSGSFDVAVSVIDVGNGVSSAGEITLVPDANNKSIHSCLLEAGTYQVTLKLADTATAKGHCVVKIGGSTLYTEAIIGANTANAEGAVPNDPFVFTITVTAPTTVVFEPHWGVVVDSDIQYNGTVNAAALTPPAAPEGAG